MKRDLLAENIIDNLFAQMVARAPRCPSKPIEKEPTGERIRLEFGRLRKRWRKPEPIPTDTSKFAEVLKQHGVYIFAVGPGHIECQAAQNRIRQALGS